VATREHYLDAPLAATWEPAALLGTASPALLLRSRYLWCSHRKTKPEIATTIVKTDHSATEVQPMEFQVTAAQKAAASRKLASTIKYPAHGGILELL